MKTPVKIQTIQLIRAKESQTVAMVALFCLCKKRTNICCDFGGLGGETPVILSKLEGMSWSVSQNWKEPKHPVLIFVILEFVQLF